MKVIYTVARTSLALSVIVLFTVSAFAQDKILLSELVVTPTDGEMIEIYNPGGSPVDLTNYYLTDATFSGDGTFYYKVVHGADSVGTRGGGGSFGDFNARFTTISPSGRGSRTTWLNPLRTKHVDSESSDVLAQCGCSL